MAENYRQRISPKLRTRLRILIVMSIVFLVLAIWHMLTDPEEWRWALIGLAIGMGIGIAMTMFDQYVWHEGEEAVVNTSNIFATVLLLLYLVFSFSKNQILDDWITRPAALGMATAWLSFGVMLVRVQRMRRDILDVLKQQFSLRSSVDR